MSTKSRQILIGIGALALIMLSVFFRGDGTWAQSTAVGSTLSNPHPYGVNFEAGIFDMQITAVDLDAWPEIQARNSANDPPAEGRRYVMWTLAVENKRGNPDVSEDADEGDFSAVVSGVRYETFSFEHWCGIIPSELDHDLFLGGKAEANVCFSLPEDDSNITLMYDVDHTDANGNEIDSEVWFRGVDDSGGTDLPTEPEFHPCDTNQNGRIDYDEVIAVISLYLFG